MKKIIILALIVLPLLQANGQRKGAKSQADEDISDSKMFGYGITTSTRSGILGGFVVRSSTPVSIRDRKPVHRYLALEVVNVRHPLESQRGSIIGSKYSYGKVNYLFVARPEFGREWYLFNKNGESSIGMSGILAVGPSFGIEKPYYIKYGGLQQEAPKTVVFDPEIHTDLGKIQGSAGILSGFLNNAKLVPGIHIKGALNLDMSTFGDSITGFEIGSTIEVFSRKTVILSPKITDSPSAFITGYVTLYIGSKKLRKKGGI